MSKKTVTYVAQSALVPALVEAKQAGWALTEKSGWLKCTAPNGIARVYVAMTKKCGRVDLSGFEMPLELGHTQLPHCGPFGRVKQQLNMGNSRSEREVVESLRQVFLYGASLPPAEATQRLTLLEQVAASTPAEQQDEVDAEQAEVDALIAASAQ